MKQLLLILSLFCTPAFADEKQKTLTVFAGIEGIKEAPFSMWEKGAPEPQGLDPDILRLVAKELGVKLSFFKVDLSKGWVDLRRELLEANLVDMLAYAYTITDERKKHVSFSQPYLVSTMNALILKDSNIKSKEDLEKFPVLAFGHTTSYKWAKKNIKGQIFASFPKSTEIMSIDQLLEKKVIGAYLGDYYNLLVMAKANQNLKVLKDPLQKEDIAIALPKSRVLLLEKINKAMIKLKRNGELEQLRKKYFEPKLSDKSK